MRPVLAYARREWLLGLQHKGELMQPALFFALMITLFALGSEPGSPQWQQLAPAMIWLAALLAALIGADRPYRDELHSGDLEQLCLAEVPLSWLMAVKSLLRWCLLGLPICLLAVPAAAALGLPQQGWPSLFLGLLLGTPVLMLLSGFVAALTVGLPRAGLLLPILILPMMAPVVIFGAGAVRAELVGLDGSAPLYFLAAILALSLSLAPWATAAAFRNALD